MALSNLKPTIADNRFDKKKPKQNIYVKRIFVKINPIQKFWGYFS